MIGLRRLDDLQACVEDVVRNKVGGDLIEAGTWRGGAAILMRATLDSLGAEDRKVWVADSFQGFPLPEESGSEDDRTLELHMSAIDYLAPTLAEVRGFFERFGFDQGVEFVPGFFEETLAGLGDRSWSLVRVDADTYKATRIALDALYPGLSIGGYLVVDDYFHPYIPTSCKLAVDEFREEHGITEPIEQIDWNSGRWRRETSRASTTTDHRGSDTGDPGGRSRAGAPRPGTPIPTDRELQLGDDIARLSAQLRDAEAKLELLERSPATPAIAWARRRARELAARAGRERGH